MHRFRAVLAVVVLGVLVAPGASAVGAAPSRTGAAAVARTESVDAAPALGFAAPASIGSSCTMTGSASATYPAGAPPINQIRGCPVDEGRLTFTYNFTGYKIFAVWRNGSGGNNAVLYQYGGRLRFYVDGGCEGTYFTPVEGEHTFRLHWKEPAAGEPYVLNLLDNNEPVAFDASCNVPESPSTGLDIGDQHNATGAGCGCVITVNDVGPLGEPEEPVDPGDGGSCPGWMPDFICGGVDMIGGIVGPIVDAIGSMSSNLLGAIGDMSETIVAAINSLAQMIWEQFKVMVFDPDTLGEALEEKMDGLKNGGLASWVDGIEGLVDSVLPDVDQDGFPSLCLVDGTVCMGESLNDMPESVETILSVMMYAWCAITYAVLVGAAVKTVRG